MHKQIKIRTRFAPSPTGAPHVGNIRTALFAWLFARHNNGKFILRIEDTDQERSQEGSIEMILESLEWMGLDIDEGVKKNSKIEEIGNFGPYMQSQRLSIYREHAQKLLNKGHAFYCFCSEERLAQMRDEQQKRKEPPRYDGLCLALSDEEVDEKLKNGEKYVVRMKIPEDGETWFQDGIKGPIVIQNKIIDNQVLLKSDGFPTYHLANVVDDHLMEITHVIRADEWLASTAKHVLLYKYFEWDAPAWVHLPVILGPDKSKLSKRHGAVSILEYRDQGYLPDAMVNFLALLGWNPKTDQEIFSGEELIKQFDLKKINKNNPIFDVVKLNWMNNQYIKKMPVLSLRGSVLATKQSRIANIHGLSNSALDKSIALVQDRMEKLTDFELLTAYLWNLPDYDADLLIPKNLDKSQTKSNLEIGLDICSKIGNWDEENIRKAFFGFCDEKGVKRGDMLWPLRVAITGLAKSPDVFGSMDVLGKDESISRVKQAIEKL